MKIIALLILMVGFIALVQWRAGQRETRAEATFAPEGQLLDVDGVQVHAVVMGEGPDIVLLHGASGNTRDFTFALAPKLAPHFRVIMFDRPGLGWTERTSSEFGGAWNTASESPAEQAQLLQKAAVLLDVENPIVIGQSYGASLAWAWGLSAPDDTAALVSIAGVANPWPGKISRLHRWNASALGGALLVPIITAFTPKRAVVDTIESIFEPQDAPMGYLDHVASELTLRRESMRANARQVTSLRPHIVEMSARFSELKMPVEIIHGDADTIVPLSVHSITLPQQMPNANLHVLKGVGHMPHHTHIDEVIAAIERAATRAGLR
ncbi:MAG: alpha/beta hydrolase [Paracoccaceae bacterium]